MTHRPFTFFLTPTSDLESKTVKLSRTPSTPTPLLTRQEAKRRATLQLEIGLPLSTTPTITATTSSNREPHGSNSSSTLPSPHQFPDESEPSDTDSSIGSPAVTFPNSKRQYKGLIKMDNVDKQPLAEVQTAKMKDCPILTAGRITPLVLQSWALACKRYMKHLAR